MSDIDSALRAIEDLFGKYEFTWHAEHVAQCRERLIREGAAAYQHLATLEWWGGSGSIADISLCRPGQKSTDESIEDNRALCLALIAVSEAMEVNGMKMDRARRWADVFRKWEAEKTWDHLRKGKKDG